MIQNWMTTRAATCPANTSSMQKLTSSQLAPLSADSGPSGRVKFTGLGQVVRAPALEPDTATCSTSTAVTNPLGDPGVLDRPAAQPCDVENRDPFREPHPGDLDELYFRLRRTRVARRPTGR